MSRYSLRIDEPDARIAAKHVIESVFAIDELQLIELHVLRGFLQISLPQHYLILKRLYKLGVLWASWTVLKQALDF